MSAYDSPMVVAAGVALVLIAVMVLNRQTMRRPAPSAAVIAATPASFVGLYAHHQGTVVGEVIAHEKGPSGIVVLRQNGVHKVVPAAGVKVVDGEVRLPAEVDWPGAEAAGKAWAAEHP